MPQSPASNADTVQGVRSPAVQAFERDLQRMQVSMDRMAKVAHPDLSREKSRILAGIAASATALGAGGFLPMMGVASMGAGETMAVAGAIGFMGVGLRSLHQMLQARWVRPQAVRNMSEIGYEQRVNLSVRDRLSQAIQSAEVLSWVGSRNESMAEHRAAMREALGLPTSQDQPGGQGTLDLREFSQLMRRPEVLPSAKHALISMAVSVHGKSAVEQALPPATFTDPKTRELLDRAYQDYDTAAWKVISGYLDASRRKSDPMEKYLEDIEPFLRLSDARSLPQSSLQGMVLEGFDRYGEPAVRAIQQSLMEGTMSSQEQCEQIHPFLQNLLHPGQIPLVLVDRDASVDSLQSVETSSDEAPESLQHNLAMGSNAMPAGA